MNVHLVAHLSLAEVVDLCAPVLARRLWVFLRRAFPCALVVVLMTNHVHVIARVICPDWARLRMAKALAAAVRGHGRYTWEHLPDAEVLTGARELRRHIRYVTLNPCRAGLVSDPLEWPWSTHRDLLGAAATPWVRPDFLAAALHERRDGFEHRFQRYASSDRSVAVARTPPPSNPAHDPEPTKSLQQIRLATLAATRGLEGDVNRRGFTRDLFVALARREGWAHRTSIASLCEMSPSALSRLQPRVPPTALSAAAICLGDPRLLDGPWSAEVLPPPAARMAESLSAFRQQSGPPSVDPDP